jgi:hypothetical protein
MMSGVPLETCSAVNKLWNNKFYYKVASCWLFLLIHTTMHGSMNIKKKMNKDLLRASGVVTKCNSARFEVLIAVFWDVMLRRLAGLYIPEAFTELPPRSTVVLDRLVV